MKVEIITTCTCCGAVLSGTDLYQKKCQACGQPWFEEETNIDEYGFEDPAEECPQCDGTGYVDHPYEDRAIQCDLCLGTGEIW